MLVAVYGVISGYMAALDADRETWRIWRTLRCGERFLGQDMSRYTSPVRPEVIDIGSAGCSNDRFWATFEEIRDAAARSEPERLRFGEVFQFNLLAALFAALGALLAVNLLGFLFLGARSLFQWVRGGLSVGYAVSREDAMAAFARSWRAEMNIKVGGEDTWAGRGSQW